MPDVYLIEDDAGIRTSVARALEQRHHVVRSSGQGLTALGEIVAVPPDVVVLDLGLPDVDGAAVLRMLRGASSVPVIVATARADEREVIALLDAGADDYVIKPYSGAELEARIRAVLRRGVGGAARSPRLVVAELEIDAATRSVRLAGAPVELSRKEFDLLALLAGRAGEVVTKREILQEVWRQPYGGGDKTVDVHLSWLRRKLGERADAPRFLRTVRGVGVMLVDPSTCAES
ncbi:MAG: response regulator transcription factor [Acidimicrobiales bacterium]|nr:response regulator transcription factor [Acidimicrobiales bacterium]